MVQSNKREALLETAESLFYQKGFHATGINEILKKSGVASMTLYRYFPSKEELIKEVLKHREEKYWSFLHTTITDSKENPFVSLVEAHGLWLGREGKNGCMLLRAMEEFSGLNSEIDMIARNHKKNVLHYLKDLAQKNNSADPEGLAVQLAVVLEGATAMAQMVGAEEVTKHAISTVKNLLDH
ncbi:TetR/AcrR family transcriptional regulator [Desmospora profundinema]|uniref:AcrR family transcriptional regulator n=1 Tax=Desmospora profundinema TaxID=1571184 RepID=A0ABU1ILP9_9BACL|nr:TetR/AcrR family transcriptional regulator [Desmospora profundinema]MDR6225710.1 AcrR family transcriptional regulator [Desmospora profundinema]